MHGVEAEAGQQRADECADEAVSIHDEGTGHDDLDSTGERAIARVARRPLHLTG